MMDVRWECGGTYRAALNGVRFMQDFAGRHPGIAAEAGQLGHYIESYLQRAHVVNLDVDQFKALPLEPDDLTDYEADPHLPFNPLYISIGDDHLSGILLESDGEQLAVVPFWRVLERNESNEYSPLSLPAEIMDMDERKWTDTVRFITPGVWEVDDKDLKGELATTMLESFAVMRFLESANVDIVDTPVSRQQRRAAARSGTRIAMTVQVRAPRASQRREGGPTEHIEFSHRFEVRGHYKHYGADTRIFRTTKRDRPHKVIQHPERGPVVRIWCPNFVKGPEDKPLVPKVRVYPKGDEE